MEVILIILTSTIIGAFILGAFYLGYKEGLKHKTDDSVVVDEKNQKAIREMVEWLNFKGGNE